MDLCSKFPTQLLAEVDGSGLAELPTQLLAKVDGSGLDLEAELPTVQLLAEVDSSGLDLEAELPTAQLLAEMDSSGLDLEADFSGASPLHVQKRSAHRRRGGIWKQKFGRDGGQGREKLEDNDSTNEDTGNISVKMNLRIF